MKDEESYSNHCFCEIYCTKLCYNLPLLEDRTEFVGLPLVGYLTYPALRGGVERVLIRLWLNVYLREKLCRPGSLNHQKGSSHAE